MKKQNYNRRAIIMAAVSPLILTLALFFAPVNAVMGIVVGLLLIAGSWNIFANKSEIPDRASEAFMPIMAVYCYFLLVWVIAFGALGYQFSSPVFSTAVSLLDAPYLAVFSFLTYLWKHELFPLIHAGVFAVAVLTVFITRAIMKKRIRLDGRFFIYLLACVILSGVAAYQIWDRSNNLLPGDYADKVGDEINYYDYMPFAPGNQLKKPDKPASVSFSSDYPRLDGATAAYPVYGAVAQELYKGLDEQTVSQYVDCTTTNEAYTRLIYGETDIFFGAQPSKGQLQAAADKGVALDMTPIAREAFVFIVNADNPVSGLTLAQIQDIYQKKITNWSEVGGRDEKIMPFQRPEDSGSQTIMLAKVMDGKPLPAPLREEYSSFMGGLVIGVAEYRNYASAIGYSFRYFATGMMQNPDIKLLAIDGVEPIVENIRSGAYPFTIDVYAVTAGTRNENAGKLIGWLVSDEGQALIEKCGYVAR